MIIKLKDKTTKPPFTFFVKENTGDFDYYIFDNVEDAVNYPPPKGSGLGM